jgi:ABC-2 type transport system permease protein
MIRPGSVLWLLAHELRLDWRRRTAVRGARRWVAVLLTLGVPMFLGLAVGAPTALALNRTGPPTGTAPAVIAAIALASAFMFMLSQALADVVDALYERGDLDLFFSSPIPPRRVIAVRALAVAFSAFTVFGFFATGPLLVMAVLGQARWLAALPLLYGLSLAATGVALAMSVGLIRLFGPKRTRIIGRVLSVVLGSAFFLATQAVTVMTGSPTSLWAALLRTGQRSFEGSMPWLGLGLEALGGKPIAFAAVAGGSVAIFLLGLSWSGPKFAALYAAARGSQQTTGRRDQAARRFRGGALLAIGVKEARLILRDPMLLPLVLLRVVYLVPLGFLAVRYGTYANFTALSGAVLALTLMANQLSGSLAWMTISAEDAPDLIATSPTPRRQILRIKLLVAVGIVLVIVALAVLPLIVIAPFQGLVAAGGAASAAVAAGLLNLWWQRPGKRSEFRKRASAPWFVTLAELALGLLTALAAGLFASHQIAGVAPALLALVVLFLLRLPVRA